MDTAIGHQNTALLVVDVQNDVVATAWERDAVVARIGDAITKARQQLVPVIYIQHEIPEYPSMSRGGSGWQIVDEIAPLEGEIIIGKRFGDAFEETDLKETLEDLDIQHLVICGSESDACVTAAFTRAQIEGFDVTVLTDAHTTSDRETDDGSVIPARQVIDHVNLRVQYMSYPGVSLKGVAVADFQFAPPVPA